MNYKIKNAGSTNAFINSKTYKTEEEALQAIEKLTLSDKGTESEGEEYEIFEIKNLKICEELINFYANMITAEQVLINSGITPTMELEEVIALSQRGWEDMPCHQEGATKTESKAMDIYLDEITKEIKNSIIN